jgi:Phospholipase B
MVHPKASESSREAKSISSIFVSRSLVAFAAVIGLVWGFFLGPGCGSAGAFAAQAATVRNRIGPAYRFEQNGWTYVHLEGSPSQIGFQHGYLLADDIQDTYHALKLLYTHSSGQNWEFFRRASRTMLWPHIDLEYQEELKGIARGLRARGVSVDVYDIVALNADMELSDYYLPWLDHQHRAATGPVSHAPDSCSAFIATGSYTKDHQIVMAHNNWTTYIEGSRWTVVFDIVPEHGQRILMDGLPGVITSQDDFAINAAGMMITETTIGNFVGWNSHGVPEFVRSRKALQYAESIDDYVRIMREGNNGGYANDWLIGDRKTGEIAYLELGLRHTPVWRTKDGYFVSSNFARDPAVIREETVGYDPSDISKSSNARHLRWEDLMQQYKGAIDVVLAEKWLGDHEDIYLKKNEPGPRSLCGHIDNSPQGVDQDWGPYFPAGAVQGKVADSELAAKMSFVARAGHPCGEDFIAKPFLAAHPQFAWMTPALKDMKAGPWTKFAAGEIAAGEKTLHSAAE